MVEVIMTSKKSVQVATLAEAPAAVRAHIENGPSGWIGGTEWSRFRKAGRVLHDGKHIATVSYNGRIWALDGSEIVPEVSP